MKLTYWVARCKDDSPVYSVRAKTKKEAQALTEDNPGSYDPIKKVEVEYRGAFDLMLQCLEEGGGHWENEPYSGE